MRTKTSQLCIGTSGWMYKDWGKKFYPKDLKKGHLTYLSNEFNTVEVNSSFYHLPTKGTFKKWHDETPAKFSFSVKLSRYITHRKKLEGVRAPLEKFIKNSKGMGTKLKVILVQLPPFFKFDKNILIKFIEDIKIVTTRNNFKARFALEPRHKSWMDNSKIVIPLLKKENIALAFPHSSKIPSFKATDKNITANFVYIRFHGPSEFAASEYGPKKLAPWAKKIKAWRKKGLDVFAYFNNDINGHAVDDARILKKQLI